MEIGTIFLLLLVVILIALFVSQPFVGRIKRVSNKGQELSALLAEQDRILAALQELDFDQLLGKIPAEEYPVQRQELLARGADILRRLDEFQGAKPGSPEERIEASVASRRADAAAKRAALSDEELEELIAKRRAARKEKAGGFCPQCGKPVLLSDRFCPSCGKTLK